MVTVILIFFLAISLQIQAMEVRSSDSVELTVSEDSQAREESIEKLPIYVHQTIRQRFPTWTKVTTSQIQDQVALLNDDEIDMLNAAVENEHFKDSPAVNNILFLVHDAIQVQRVNKSEARCCCLGSYLACVVSPILGAGTGFIVFHFGTNKQS